jgi:flagellar biosynthesis protein FlhA
VSGPAQATAKPRLAGVGDLLGGVGVVAVLALAVLPLPTWLLDLLLGAALCSGVVIFLLSVYVERPLDFSALPSLLLLVTLFRLALSIATTRIILTNGGGGTHSAGSVIEAFGRFAVGGNFVVGAVVFLILVIVNFIVITKGADRISEVSARFTLDSMPGKQMAIDADLGAGLINEREARERRRDIEHEADFHGAMDGASKFVRGDAVAGLLIVGINIIGGMIIGVAQHGMPVGDAVTTYTVLSIGDGLVSQIPALLISTGAALLATRGSSGSHLGAALGRQLFSRSRPMIIAAGVLGMLGLVPGMPHLAFFALAGFLAIMGSRANKAAVKSHALGPAGALAAPGAAAGASDRPDAAGTPSATAQKAELEALLPVELLSLEVGLDILPMVDAARNGELLGRIASLRKQMAQELGFIVPPVHVRDDLRLRPGAYKLMIAGVKVAAGEVRVGRLLAIDPSGRGAASIQGEAVTEPTFGLPARWIAPADRSRAEAARCTVVDPAAVIATHLTEVVRRHGHELLGRREAQELLDIAAKTNAKVVEELIPHLMSLGDVIKVLRNLLTEGVSIRDVRTILEALADNAGQVKDPAELTELVRQRLARSISVGQASDAGELRALVLDPRAEEIVRAGARGAEAQALTRVVQAMEEAARKAVERDDAPVLVTAPDVRRAVAAIAQRHVPGLTVLSYREIDPSVRLVTSAVVAAPTTALREARA